MRKYNIFLLFVILFLSSLRLNIIAVYLDARRYSGYWISGTNSAIYMKVPGGNKRTSPIQFINDVWILLNYRVYC